MINDGMTKSVDNEIFFKFSTFQQDLPPSSFESIYQVIDYAVIKKKNQVVLNCHHVLPDENPYIFSSMNVNVNEQTMMMQTAKFVRLVIDIARIKALINAFNGLVSNDKISMERSVSDKIEVLLYLDVDDQLGFGEEIQQLEIKRLEDTTWENEHFFRVGLLNKGSYYKEKDTNTIIKAYAEKPAFVDLFEQVQRFKQKVTGSGFNMPNQTFWNVDTPFEMAKQLYGVKEVDEGWFFFPNPDNKIFIFMIFRVLDLENLIAFLGNLT